ncbi:MAG: hypothetical protein JWQ79_3765 [Mucilaginibacter sp.]|nr:hypothetical protein [Mucilaginibacter sp.]
MKNLFKIALLSAGVLVAVQADAQEHKSVGHKIGSAATDVGHKTSEVAAKGAAAVTDKRYEGHWAPTGENVYIDKRSRYFYVDKRGHRSYLKKSQLRDKPYKHK